MKQLHRVTLVDPVFVADDKLNAWNEGCDLMAQTGGDYFATIHVETIDPSGEALVSLTREEIFTALYAKTPGTFLKAKLEAGLAECDRTRKKLLDA